LLRLPAGFPGSAAFCSEYPAASFLSNRMQPKKFGQGRQ
jgi:hypothetical protein